MSGTENKAKGKGEELGGRAQEAVGDLTGDQEQQDKGQAKQNRGTVQQAVGGIQDKVEDVKDKVTGS